MKGNERARLSSFCAGHPNHTSAGSAFNKVLGVRGYSTIQTSFARYTIIILRVFIGFGDIWRKEAKKDANSIITIIIISSTTTKHAWIKGVMGLLTKLGEKVKRDFRSRTKRTETIDISSYSYYFGYSIRLDVRNYSFQTPIPSDFRLFILYLIFLTCSLL